MLSENGFSVMGPKIRFLRVCYQKRSSLVRDFLIKFSDSPILLENPDFLTGWGYQKNFIRKGFQFLPDDCVAAVTVAVAAYTSTPQAENIKHRSVGTRSRVTRRGRRSSRVPRKYLYVAFEACVVQQLRPRYRLLLDDVAELFAW